MQLTYKFKYYRNFDRLLNLCKISKNLYNQGNYVILNDMKANNGKKKVNYRDLDRILKVTTNLENEVNYRLLKSHTSQQILMNLDKNWKSFFMGLRAYKKDPSKFKEIPKPPNYKGFVNALYFTKNICQIKGDRLILYKDLSIKIPEYKGRNFEKFQQVRILPRKGYVEVEIVYNFKEDEPIVNDNIIGIDLGLNNFATLVSNQFSPIIFSGKQMKSANQRWNKRMARLQSEQAKFNKKTKERKIWRTKLQDTITEKRNRKIDDVTHKISKKIVEIAQSNNVSRIVVGKNVQWKTSIDLGNKTNQKFCEIPHAKFINKLRYKCLLKGIQLLVTEESYTSKVDHLALEELGHHDNYLGKRVHRGLFRSSTGIRINADVNGAIGILRKVVDDSLVKEIINKGNLLTPFRVRNIFNDISCY